jgi:predicted adenylyl cyclase CyaB
MEYEAKFQLPHLAEIRKRILALGGRLLQERMLERNLRFDDRQGSLTASHQVIRLRQDREVTMTYKRGVGGIESRIEIELRVDDFETARKFLESLGYAVMHEYEKYRETFALNSNKIMLDELPFGCYVEIEADSLEAVRKQAVELGFTWDQRVRTTYLDLFNRLRKNLHFEFEDATFQNFDRLDEATRGSIASSLSEFYSQLE